MHDDHGFPDALYELDDPAPGDPALAETILETLRAGGWPAEPDGERGRDHGAWQTARLIWPSADLPVLQLSLLDDLEPHRHLELGRALAPLREQGVLLLATGTAVHNLRQWCRDRGTTPDWAAAFDAWLADRIGAGDLNALVDFCRLTPLFVALGAAGETGVGRPLHRGFEYGCLSMASYAFG